MREETQIRERIERLIRENETHRQVAACHLLTGQCLEAKAIFDLISFNASTVRALDWVLGGKA
jgi:hypothetical protein